MAFLALAPEVEKLLLPLDGVTLPLKVSEVFGRPGPLELELGVGKGLFAITWAAKNPDRNLLGVERSRKYLQLAALRAARAGVSNLRLVHTTGEDLLFRCLGSQSLAGVHVYFPDPWPKKRHHKRRFFKPENLNRLAEVMASGAVLRVKTDHQGYAQLIATLVSQDPRFIPLPEEVWFAEIPPTHFETKYLKEGRKIFRFAWQRC